MYEEQPSLSLVSNLLGSPASGESKAAKGTYTGNYMFPIYWVPQRVGSGPRSGKGWWCRASGFQFIGFPSEWGVPVDRPVRLG